MNIHSGRTRSLWIVAFTVAFTIGITDVAAARVFRCTSGDVFCLIGSIRSANERPGLHRIILDPGTYTLTVIDNTIDSELGGNGLPSITSRLTIEGAGPVETIIQAPSFPGFPVFRILHIAASGTLTLRRVTLRGGADFFPGGGAIFNRGTLALSESVIYESDGGDNLGGGAIQNLGALRIADSLIFDSFGRFGGGLLSFGTLHVVRSTIVNNVSESGGGIAAFGISTIEDSTISQNWAFAGEGGGLWLGGTTTIVNTTIANNVAGDFGKGGGISADGTARLINVTVADNIVDDTFSDPEGGGAGIFARRDSFLQLQNTILARNTSLRPNVGPDCLGSIISLGNNILGNIADCLIDLRGTDYIGDARLGDFVDDGTPGGGHIPLLPDSPAIDAGDRKSCPKRDQLGQRRVAADGTGRPACDIGAVEFVP